MRPDTEPWWRQAEAEMQTANLLLANQRHYAASWFAQQAAEKALAKLGVAPAVELQLDILNPAFDARYPGASPGSAPVDSVTPAKSQEPVAAAREILAWVRGQLP